MAWPINLKHQRRPNQPKLLSTKHADISEAITTVVKIVQNACIHMQTHYYFFFHIRVS